MEQNTPRQQQLAAEFADQIFVAELQRGIGEVEKSFQYFRANRDRGLLLAMLCQRRKVKQPFAQNRNTAEYYDRLLSVLSQFLVAYPAVSDNELLIILGWGIRLAKYRDKMRSGNVSSTGGFAPKVPYDSQLVEQACVSIAQANVRPPANPAARQLPAIGDTFTGKVTAADETAVLIAVPGFGEDKAIGVISADALGGRTDRYRVGNSARVEVTGARTLKSGRTILELKPAARRQEMPGG